MPCILQGSLGSMLMSTFHFFGFSSAVLHVPSPGSPSHRGTRSPSSGASGSTAISSGGVLSIGDRNTVWLCQCEVGHTVISLHWPSFVRRDFDVIQCF